MDVAAHFSLYLSLVFLVFDSHIWLAVSSIVYKQIYNSNISNNDNKRKSMEWDWIAVAAVWFRYSVRWYGVKLHPRK